MLKRLIFAAFVTLSVIAPVCAAQIVNVEYIHKSIEQKWGVTVPYNPALGDEKIVANMKYLLTAVDVANQMLGTTTNYGNDAQYATLVVADTVATDTAIDTLIKAQEPKFTITTTPDTDSFSFTTSAKGSFTIDWGDGTVQPITRSRATVQTYSHLYSTAATYKITIEGQATMYNISNPAISFKNNENIAELDGSLGKIFGTIGTGDTLATQPVFSDTFSGCTSLTKISSDLFSGISGTMQSMFSRTFYGCTNLTSIPSGLFASISGPAESLFGNTFEACISLKSIPNDLFSSISGAASRMFMSTFRDCTSLQHVPAGLFSSISGAENSLFDSTFDGCTSLETIPSGLFAGIDSTADMLFFETFKNCENLTGIPANLFGDMSGDLMTQTFYGTFSGCTALTGQSAKIGSQFLYQKWPDATATKTGNCYKDASGLTDWADIPDDWK
ncbi:hypothetical protein HDR66_02205 [bacterium]|nr:hypothetical protein [bacterium]